MCKIPIILTIFMIVLSCNKKYGKDLAIANSQAVRTKKGLIAYRKNIRIDSFFFYMPNNKSEFEYYDFLIDTTYKNNDLCDTCFLVEHTTDTLLNIRKTIYYYKEMSVFSILMEYDIYKLYLDSLVEKNAVIVYDYKSDKTKYGIDSIPTEKLKEQINNKVREIAINMNNRNLMVCGNALQQYRIKLLPLTWQEITYKEFDSVIKNRKD